VASKIEANAENASGEVGLNFHTGKASALNKRLSINRDGDISFYEDTGTTPKLFWDASAESLGIGTTSPGRTLEVYSSQPALKFNNGTNAWTVGTGGFVDGSDSLIFFEEGTGERMRLDSSGNLGIGTTNPVRQLQIGNNTGANDIISLQSDPTGQGSIMFGDDQTTAAEYRGMIRYNHPSDAMQFWTSSTERMRLDSSGNLLVGHTGTNIYADSSGQGISANQNGRLDVKRDDVLAIFNRTSWTSGNAPVQQFRTNGTAVGEITVTSSGTTYNTTSDARLKTDIQPIADATDRLMQMNPVSHKWKADPEADAVVGFIAQEMQEIVPEAVSGEPDGDEMMSMDYGRITPVIVAALQDAHRKIQELESRLAAVEK
jgi:hypothetical protein